MRGVKGMRAGWWPLAMLLVALLLVVPPAAAAKKTNDKFDGGSNPTNVAIVDTDLQFAVAGLADALLEYEETHEVSTGGGVTVAVLDGGFDLSHPELAGHIVYPGYDAIDGDDDPSDVGNGVDDNGDGLIDGALGHGTFVAGMVLKSAPDARILPIRVRDDEGFGSNVELMDGISYAMAMDVDVINMSISQAKAQCKGLISLINDAFQSGIVVVVSAGNDGNTWLPKMGYAWGAITVGALEYDNRIADFSNYDPEGTDGLMIFAPGVDLEGPYCEVAGGSRAVWSGTSFSAGIVSGAVALARAARPAASAAETRDRLRHTADPVLEPDGSELPGLGRINLLRVVSGQ